MYDVGIPFNAVKCDSFGLAIEPVDVHGCGMNPQAIMRYVFLCWSWRWSTQKKLLTINEAEKKLYGCSLMVGGWRDRNGRSLINFLVNTPQGSMFIELVDASACSHTSMLFFFPFYGVISFFSVLYVVFFLFFLLFYILFLMLFFHVSNSNKWILIQIVWPLQKKNRSERCGSDSNG